MERDSFDAVRLRTSGESARRSVAPPVVEASPDEFHLSIRSWLRSVWKFRSEILGRESEKKMSSYIYSIYASGGDDDEFDETRLRSFNDWLEKLASKYNYTVFEPAPSSSAGVILAQPKEEGEMTDRDFWVTFYHFEPKTVDYNLMKKRIYINANSKESAMTIAEQLLSMMTSQANKIQKFKIVGPGSGVRPDSVVIYLQTDEHVTSVTNQLLRWKPFAGLVKEGLPPAVLKRHTGVGTADEPPGAGFLEGDGARKSQSFGYFYADIMAIALKQNNSSLGAFVGTLKGYLLILGVNPAQPSLIPSADQIERLAELGEQAQLRRASARSAKDRQESKKSGNNCNIM